MDPLGPKALQMDPTGVPRRPKGDQILYIQTADQLPKRPCYCKVFSSQFKGAVCYCRVLCHLGAMASSHSVGPVAKSVVLYGCMEKETLDAEAGSGAIPVDRLGSYVGLGPNLAAHFSASKTGNLKCRHRTCSCSL